MVYHILESSWESLLKKVLVLCLLSQFGIYNILYCEAKSSCKQVGLSLTRSGGFKSDLASTLDQLLRA